MEKNKTIIFLVLIVAVGALLRGPRFFSVIPDAGVIGPKIAWYDETVSIFFSIQDIPRLAELSGLDTTPCLFYIILHFWLLLTGTGSVPLIAILPLIFSLAAIPAIYYLGREMFDQPSGLTAAALLALSPLNIQYAAEIRAYSLLVLIAIFFILFLWRAMQRGNRCDFVGLAVFTLLLLYTHYSSIALILPGYLLLIYFKKKEIRKIIACTAAVIIGYLPALYFFQRWGDFFGAGSGSSYGRFSSNGSIFAFFQYLYTVVFGVFGNNAAPAVLSVAVLALSAYLWRKQNDYKNRFLIILLIAGWAVLALMKLIFYERYYIVFSIPIILIVAAASSGVQKKSWPLMAAGASLFIFLFILPLYITDNSRAFKYFAPSFAQIIKNQAGPGDIIVADHFSQMAWRQYLTDGPEVKLFFPFGGKLTDDWRVRWRFSDYPVVNGQNAGLVKELVGDSKRFWLVGYSEGSLEDPSDALKKYLDTHYNLLAIYYFPESAGRNIQKTELRLYSSAEK